MDYDYVVNCAKIAKEANVPHMAYVSSERANSSSFFLYIKTKGEVNYENNIYNIYKLTPFLRKKIKNSKLS